MAEAPVEKEPPENAHFISEEDRLVREIGYISNYLEALRVKHRELTGEGPRRAEMLRRGLQGSVDDGFMTQQQADAWLWEWVGRGFRDP